MNPANPNQPMPMSGQQQQFPMSGQQFPMPGQQFPMQGQQTYFGQNPGMGQSTCPAFYADHGGM